MINLVSFDDLKAILGLEKDETDYPALTVIKNSVVAMFEDFTHRSFKFTIHEEQSYVYSKTKMIPLKALPISKINSINLDGTPITDYKITPYGLELAASVEGGTITTNYEGGITGSIPSNLNRAALLQTAYEYQNSDSIGQQTVSTEGGTITKSELGMLKEVKVLLQSAVHPFPHF